MTAAVATLRLRREGTLRSRAARGDAAAFGAVYERHHQALYRYCRSILRHEEDAQDALQSTMARAFAALQTEQRDFELRPWLFRIAHNEAISILRRRRVTEELDDVAGFEGDMEQRVSEREELRLLQMDLADLPERQRAALVLRELNGLSHAEIGTVLELEPRAVKQTIFEARTALFSCREGREMACHDVRRMLSDGDGRVLRGRGIRAHLRTCPECRRFQADLKQRPQALRMLAPPMPTAGAAALLSQLLGAPAAKLLACAAIAGGGATLAVEVQHAREPARTSAAEKKHTSSPPAPRRAAPPTAVKPPPQPVLATTAAQQPTTEKVEAARPHATKQARTAPQKRRAKRPSSQAKAEAPPGLANKPGALPPGQAKKVSGESVAKTKPKTVKPANSRKPTTAPGRAKQQAKTRTVPPGQARQPAKAAPAPPVQARERKPVAVATPVVVETVTEAAEDLVDQTPLARGKKDK